jgi:O-antigen/teichoic acid export membrane protein
VPVNGAGPHRVSPQLPTGGIVSEAQPHSQESGPSRSRLAVRGSAFEMGGFGLSQVVRLGGNLVLTRLLFPEAFGLAALTSIFLQGLQMLSDVGLRQAVIQNPRGDEPAFLNTAWTLQVVRGFALWVVGLALAWPMAWIYSEPQLAWLLVVASFQAVIQGFLSTSLFTLRRRVELAPLALLEVAAQLVMVGVMVTWALIHPTVWALVGGGLAATVFRLIASHLLPVDYRNRFAWEEAARREILHFGKWIFGSSAVLFASQQADRLLLGQFLGVAVLGVYSIAVMVSEVVGTLIGRVAHNVLYPIFSQVGPRGIDEVRRVYYRSRLHLDLLSMPAVGGLAVLGPWVVELLWDARYAEAGWMLQVLCIRVAMSCVSSPCDRCLMALGHTRYTFYRSAARAVWMLVGIPVGWRLAGLDGVIWATGLSELPVLAILWAAFHREGLLRMRRELLAPIFFAAGAGVAMLMRPLLAAWSP